MKHHRRHFLFTLSILIALVVARPVLGAAAGELPQGFQRLELTVDGVTREALVYAPASAKEKSTPVVFVWHGHGGNMRQSARGLAMNTHWPEAISVYAQGLNTPGRLTDPEGKKPGWQHSVGAQGDRDLKFFDALLAKLKVDYKVDGKRIYSTGHSNGGGFTYLLWSVRGDVFAAVAPSAAAASGMASQVGKLKPKPAMHLAGENDPLVKYEWQKAAMEAVRKLNGCESEGKPWDKQCLIYESKGGTPFVSFIHPGGHEFKPEAPALIAKFFKEHPAAGK
ncbi:MAG TPA: PHB depolymerase family esterase [Verrucomicrobiae bacterium]|jgi:polyhydroxybutyrate depolymerase